MEGGGDIGYLSPYATVEHRSKADSGKERTGKEKREGPFEINSIQRFMLALGQFTH